MSISVDGLSALACDCCGGDVPLDLGLGFDKLRQTTVCPHCFTTHIVEYDYSLNEDTGRDDGWFYLVMGEPA